MAAEGRSEPGAAVPPKRISRRNRTWALTAGTALVSATLAWLLGSTSLFQLLELKTYDLRIVLRGKETPPSNIILITIDERTEQAIPEPRIFWHGYYAAVLRAAASGGARAIGLDVSFALPVEQWTPGADRELAAAFSEVTATTPVVLAYDSLQPPPAGLPLYILGSTQESLGFTNLTLDRDNFVRRQELRSRDPQALQSFAMRLAALARHVEPAVPDTNRRTLQFGGTTVPLDRSGFLLIHHWGPGGIFPAVSMADVLAAVRKADAAQMERWFRDKIVLIGTLDTGDQHATPFYLGAKEQKGAEKQSLTPGVEIHASAVATLLEQRFLRESPDWVTPALVLVASAVAALLIFMVGFPLAPFILSGAVGLYLVATLIAMRYEWVLPVTPPLLSAVLGGLVSYGAYSLTEGRQRRLLQDVFGRYVSSELAAEVLAQGEIPLGGSVQVVTVMFSDLRNFTNYCQGRDPTMVVAELNEYFTDMTAEIKAHGGMVNKFIGDGIMALFGAPVPHPDDARRAVACALHMVQRNDEFNQRRAERGLEPLVIGIALHTGSAVVGTIGAPEKMEYTAIGDTVNVASRIEGENKMYGSQLLVSKETYERVRDSVEAELAGHANLKGVSEPVAVYKIVKLKGAASCSLERF